MPGGYTYFRRVGARKTESGSAVFIPVVQNVSGECYLQAVVQDVNDFSTNSRVSTLLPSIPPCVGITARISAEVKDNSNTNNRDAYITSLDEADHTQPTLSNDKDATASYTPGHAGNLLCRTNGSGNIGLKVSNSNARLQIYTQGWIDSRGMDE